MKPQILRLLFSFRRMILRISFVVIYIGHTEVTGMWLLSMCMHVRGALVTADREDI